MSAMGWFDLRQSIYLRTNFGWLGYLLGGFMFGVGMTLGAGCGQRTLVRVGGGNLKSLIVLLVLALTAYMTLRGLFAVFRIEVIQASNIDLSERGLADQSIATFLSAFTGLSPRWAMYITAGALGLGTIVYALKDKTFRRSFDDVFVAVVVGSLIAGAWYVTGVIGNDEFEPVPLEAVSFIAPAGDTLNYLMTYTGSVINFGIAVVLGMIAGSSVYAILSGNFRIETFASRGDMINHLYAGALMGIGGVLSGAGFTDHLDLDRPGFRHHAEDAVLHARRGFFAVSAPHPGGFQTAAIAAEINIALRVVCRRRPRFRIPRRSRRFNPVTIIAI
jgi:hypothetical protein